MTDEYKNHEVIPQGDYAIQNNAWGCADDYPAQHVFIDSPALFGWHWNFPSSSASAPMAYPEVIYGKKPDLKHKATCQALPIRIDNISVIEANYFVETSVSGSSNSYNTAFDLWITSDEKALPSDKVAEVMIWISNNGPAVPHGILVETLSTAYGYIDLYSGQMQVNKGISWDCFTFYLRDMKMSGPIDLWFFLGKLIHLNLLNTEDFLASIEFGNEIWFGQGVTHVHDYSVTIK